MINYNELKLKPRTTIAFEGKAYRIFEEDLNEFNECLEINDRNLIVKWIVCKALYEDINYFKHVEKLRKYRKVKELEDLLIESEE